ncbi:trypsin 3A1-like [Sabethes cyaneus]|uniref:trypsin 3A1-like n=1 Tax=Sabethes cyaneus TaxID=53552 RepID=UPI00237E3C07|nr:trypsin 3A1-like [Sabethes cyaneus]
MKVWIFVFVVFAVTATVCTDDTEEAAWQAAQVIPEASRIFVLRHSKRVIGLEKIIGGQKVDVKNFPYQLSLRSNGNHICGGSAISRDWALTAAHCLYPGRDVATISLRAGSSGRLSGGQIYNVSQIIFHPQYNPALFDKDVALLKVAIPFQGQNIAPILLVSEGYEPVEGIRSMVSGWGRTLTDTSLPTILHAVDIPIVGRSTCSLLWGEGLVTNDMICAGQSGRDSCNGDSGGPLVSGGRQIGLVSWGSTECGGSLPAVYTHLAATSVRRFIRRVTGV